MNDPKAAQRMSSHRYTVKTYHPHMDGFSGSVSTELEAYRLAYDWNHSERVVVKKNTGGDWWVVQVWNQKQADSYRAAVALAA